MDEVKVEVELADAPIARAIQARLRQRLGLGSGSCRSSPGSCVPDRQGPARAGPAPAAAERGMQRAQAVRGEQRDRGSAPRPHRDRRAEPGRPAGPRGGPRARLRRQPPHAPRGDARALERPPSFALEGPGGGIFVAATPEQGIGPSLSESVASMLEARSIDRRADRDAPAARGPARRAGGAACGRPRRRRSRPCSRSRRPARVTLTGSRIRRARAPPGGRHRGQPAGRGLHRLDRGRLLQPRLREMIEPAVVEPVIAEQHRDLIQAIRRGDPSAAERAMREHLTYLRDVVDAVRSAGGWPWPARRAARSRRWPRRRPRRS